MFENSSSSFPVRNQSGAGSIDDGDCQFSKDSSEEKVIKVFAYVSILLVSLVGNTLVIVVVYKNKHLRKSINYFVFNMAASDLLMSLTIMPVRIGEIVTGSSAFIVDSPFLVGNILCKLCYFLPDASIVVSIESLVLIAIDRFIAVVYPLKATLITSKSRSTCILCAWIVAVAVYAPYFYTFRLFPYEDGTYECRQRWDPAFDHEETHKWYVTVISITFFILPVCVLAILYAMIACTVKQNATKRKRMSSRRSPRKYQTSRQVLRLSVAIIIAFLACIFPMLVNMFMVMSHLHSAEEPTCAFLTLLFISYFMVHSWSALNPCICFAFGKNYRNGLKYILSREGYGFQMEGSTSRGTKNTIKSTCLQANVSAL